MSHFGCAPLFQSPQKCWYQTFFIMFYLSTFYPFDDIEKNRNHSWESFCFVKADFDKNSCATYVFIFVFAFYRHYTNDGCDRKSPKTIIIFKLKKLLFLRINAGTPLPFEEMLVLTSYRIY